MSESLVPFAIFEGLLLGTAVGDAIGLPYEGLSKTRAKKLFRKGVLRHRLLGPYGLCDVGLRMN